jgi:hypothetical protein
MGCTAPIPITRAAPSPIAMKPMRRMIDASGLKPKRPYVKGWWSGAHDDAEDGQDAAILDGEISPLELITVADIASFVEEYAIVF